MNAKMKRTKLGISDALLCAAIYFTGLFSGYLVAILLTGYVLLFEENTWLKENAIRAVALMAVFSTLTTGIGLISNTFGILSRIISLAGENLSAGQLTQVTSLCTSLINLFEDILFLVLGFKALRHESITVTAVESIIIKHT